MPASSLSFSLSVLSWIYHTLLCILENVYFFISDFHAEMLKFTCAGDVLQGSKCLDEFIGETGTHISKMML